MASSQLHQPVSGSQHPIKNIAIVGANGNIGKYITSSLLEKGCFNVTVLSRVDSSRTFPPGVHATPIDYADPSTIEAALQGQDALIITLSFFAPKDTSAKLIRAAAAAGVPWILPNTYGMYNTEAAQLETIGSGQSEDRKLIEELGVSSWIGVSCGFWYQHALANPNLYGIDIQNRAATFFDDGTQRLNTSTWAQVGRAVAALLSLPVQSTNTDDTTTLSAYRNRMIYVSSFTINQKDMFASLKRVTGTSDDEWTVSHEPARQRFKDAQALVREGSGDIGAFARMLCTRFFFPNENAGLFEVSHGLDNEKLGLPEEDLDEATRHAVKLAESEYWENYGRT